MEHPKALGDHFNIMGPNVTWYESAKYQKEKSGIEYVELEVPCGWRYHMATTKATNILGWTHRYGYKKMYDSALAYQAGKDIGIPY
jgi:nucleoside-diphosphate-sugar epimerase